MRHIIDCDPEHLEAATARLREEVADIRKYTKTGWGWDYGNYQTGPRFFVRKLKDGLSVKQLALSPGATHDR